MAGTDPAPDWMGSGFADILGGITSSANTTPEPKINQQGQVDLYGIGQNSGTMFPLGLADDGRSRDRGGPGGDANSSGHSHAGDPYLDTTSTDDYLKALARLSQTNPSEFMSIQQGLYNSGFYGSATPGEVGFGRWNQKTKDALVGANGALTNFIELYKSGAAGGQTFNEWLKTQASLAAADPNSPGNLGGRSTPPLQLTDPAQIQAQGDAASAQYLGHAMTAQDQANLVNTVQGNDQQVYDAQQAGVGGTVTSKNPAAQARAFVLQNQMPEYASHQAEGYMNVFANMFLGGQSARANTSIGDAAVTTK